MWNKQNENRENTRVWGIGAVVETTLGIQAAWGGERWGVVSLSMEGDQDQWSWVSRSIFHSGFQPRPLSHKCTPPAFICAMESLALTADQHLMLSGARLASNKGLACLFSSFSEVKGLGGWWVTGSFSSKLVQGSQKCGDQWTQGHSNLKVLWNHCLTSLASFWWQISVPFVAFLHAFSPA